MDPLARSGTTKVVTRGGANALFFSGQSCARKCVHESCSLFGSEIGMIRQSEGEGQALSSKVGGVEAKQERIRRPILARLKVASRLPHALPEHARI